MCCDHNQKKKHALVATMKPYLWLLLRLLLFTLLSLLLCSTNVASFTVTVTTNNRVGFPTRAVREKTNPLSLLRDSNNDDLHNDDRSNDNNNNKLQSFTPPFSSLVWFQLFVEGDGKNGDPFPIDSDKLPRRMIFEVAMTAYKAKDKSLGHCNAADLVVYKAGTAFPPNKEDRLRSSMPVPEDTTYENPLRVLAPAIKDQQSE